MAGLYPDPPSRRMGWDSHSVLFGYNSSSVVAEGTPSNRAEMNDEDNNDAFRPISGNGAHHFGVLFPELREIDGVYAAHANPMDTVDTSADTTNGKDGTWTNRIANIADSTAPYAGDYRNQITSMAVSSARGIRVQKQSSTNGYARALHIYGEISPGQTPDKMLWIDDATGLEFTIPYMYDETPRGSSEDKAIRLRNDSASLTANTVQYTAEDLYLGSGAWFTLTLPGGSTYQATQQISSIASATTTGIITLRRITPGGFQLGLHAPRLYVNVDSWT